MSTAALKGKRVAVGMGGGIAAYKVADLVRELRRAGAEVRVAMTEAAQQFVTPLTLMSLSGNPVLTNYFDTAQFPTATFTSTSVSGSAGHLTVNGNLTLHGITRPVTLDVEGPAGPVTGMDKKPHNGYSATTTLKRKDFGVGAKTPDNIVSDEIILTIDLDVAKQ